jgi:cystathionine beta-lyase
LIILNAIKFMELSYIINHLGEEREQYFNAVSPPIVQSSNFAFKDIATMRTGLADELNTPFYTRGCNPTVAILRKKIAALEKAADALIFSSGSAAMAAAVISQVKAGDHIICVTKPYSWTNKLLNQLLQRLGVEISMVDGTDINNYRAAIQANTRLLIAESPNSLTFELQDIAALVALAKQYNFRTIIDNSYATPLYQSPIPMGIDLVVHSASKYLNGHSDVVAGALCGSSELITTIFEREYMTLGGIISPHDAWLMLRGLRTFPLRVARSHETAMQVTAFLAQHPAVEQVYFPFLPTFPQYELAQKQMSGSGGLFSIRLRATRIEQVEDFCNRLRYFLLACSWGGHESLVFPMCVLYTSQNYQQSKALPWNLVRFYVGLEEPELLIADLERALSDM